MGYSEVAVVDAVRAGTLDEAVLDEGVRRVLRLVLQAQPALAEGGSFDVDEHHALARRVAHESAVLLKNDGGVLPLRPAAGPRVAVIGEFARTPRYQGAGSSQVNPTRVDIPLDELTAALGAQVTRGLRRGLPLDSAEEDAALLDEADPHGAPGPTTWWSSSGCPCRRSPRASTGPPWTCRPTSSPCCSG